MTLDAASPGPPAQSATAADELPDAPGQSGGERDSGRPTWVRGALIGGAVACGCAAIALVDPTDSGVPVCWSAGLFGVDCPLCGGLRCVNSLVRGNWFAAADHNVLLAVALPVIAVAWVVWMGAAVRGRTIRWPSVPVWVWTSLAVVVIAFTVVRNLDLGPVAHYLAASSR